MHNFLVDLVTVTIVLGIMIFVHEWGHFMAAKLCGVRVDVFSLGFGPRLFGMKRGDTDYRISALPFGGYVRMAGDNPLEERTGAGYEFLSRPRWQRVIIAIAGPAMNFVLALVILWGIFWRLGIPSPVFEHQAADIVAVPQSIATTGVQPGDRIIAVNGVPTPTWKKVYSEYEKAKPGTPITIAVSRSGANQIITATTLEHLASPDTLFGYPPLAAVIAEVDAGTPADRAGLKPGDTIIAMNGKPVITWQQLVEGVHQSGGHSIQFGVRRDGQQLELDITPMQGTDLEGQPVWQVGVLPNTDEDYERQSFLEAGKDAASSTVSGMRQIGQVLVGLFSGKVSIRQLAGPVGIARISGEAAKRGLPTLLEFMAVISLNLGLLNLLPIPILDGGHILMLAIEGILRRDLSIAVKERFVQVGLVFLLGIFAFVMYSDILKAVQSHR
ncbi:MAG TPA: RIP metalloprotease RseP [Candidatus Acidoferrales bacterium]|jgi:regulator of sigma E protease|nr:RIP metalloprotease RseP [Candidatus Acidoferrales bacterium]